MRKARLIAAFSILVLLGAGVPARAQADPGDAAYQAHDYSAAAQAYRSAVQANPKNGLAWYRLGVSLTALGRYDDAAAALRASLDNGFDASSSHYRLAQLAAKRARGADVVAELQAAVKARPIDPDALQSDDAFAAYRNDAAFVGLIDGLQHAVHPCRFDPAFHALDFWLGDWVVRAQAGYELGRSHIERAADGCAIREAWTGGLGDTGASLSAYDPAVKRWRQYYFGSKAYVTDYLGGVEGSSVVLVAKTPPAPGAPAGLLRMTYTPLTDGRVRQFMETSTDEGKTWKPGFDGYYSKL